MNNNMNVGNAETPFSASQPPGAELWKQQNMEVSTNHESKYQQAFEEEQMKLSQASYDDSSSAPESLPPLREEEISAPHLEEILGVPMNLTIAVEPQKEYISNEYNHSVSHDGNPYIPEMGLNQDANKLHWQRRMGGLVDDVKFAEAQAAATLDVRERAKLASAQDSNDEQATDNDDDGNSSDDLDSDDENPGCGCSEKVSSMMFGLHDRWTALLRDLIAIILAVLAWWFYSNNKGVVTVPLRVEQVAARILATLSVWCFAPTIANVVIYLIVFVLEKFVVFGKEASKSSIIAVYYCMGIKSRLRKLLTVSCVWLPSFNIILGELKVDKDWKYVIEVIGLVLASFTVLLLILVLSKLLTKYIGNQYRSKSFFEKTQLSLFTEQVLWRLAPKVKINHVNGKYVTDKDDALSDPLAFERMSRYIRKAKMRANFVSVLANEAKQMTPQVTDIGAVRLFASAAFMNCLRIQKALDDGETLPLKKTTKVSVRPTHHRGGSLLGNLKLLPQTKLSADGSNRVLGRKTPPLPPLPPQQQPAATTESKHSVTHVPKGFTENRRIVASQVHESKAGTITPNSNSGTSNISAQPANETVSNYNDSVVCEFDDNDLHTDQSDEWPLDVGPMTQPNPRKGAKHGHEGNVSSATESAGSNETVEATGSKFHKKFANLSRMGSGSRNRGNGPQAKSLKTRRGSGTLTNQLKSQWVYRHTVEAILNYKCKETGITLNLDKAWRILDPNNLGYFNYQMLRGTVRNMFRSRRDLAQSLQDATSVVKKLGYIIDCLGIFCAGIITVTVFFGVDWQAAWLAISSVVLGFAFIFGSFMKTTFENLVFVFSERRFDVGDMLIIDDNYYYVKQIDLLSTTTMRWDGLHSVFPHHYLRLKSPLVNCNRGANHWQYHFLFVDISCCHSDLKQYLHKGLRKFTKRHPEAYTGGIQVVMRHMASPLKVKLQIFVEFAYNLQDMGVYCDDNSYLLETIMDLLRARMDITFTNVIAHESTT